VSENPKNLQNANLTRDDVLRRMLKTPPKQHEKFASCKTRNSDNFSYGEDSGSDISDRNKKAKGEL
jgi:hypothetical protein